MRKINCTSESKIFISIISQTDLEALENNGDSRGLKENSIINQIRFVHVCDVGFIPPCVMHDVYQGM